MAQPRTIDKAGKQNGTKIVGLRVTPAQLAQLKKDARAANMTISELVRYRALREFAAA